MSSKKPHRHEIIDREFPVRLTIASDPATFEITRIWLQRHVGTGNYASKPQILWSSQRAQNVYFRNLHDALMFAAGCPHIRLIGERYSGSHR
jgi:hypothetical protein